jgi:hypothetical protein
MDGGHRGRSRHRAQDTLGLTDAREAGPRTWSYRLTDRSSDAVARILSHPSVEDTHRLDRARLRITVDQPGLPSWVRELLESGLARPVALLLLAAAAVPLWLSRRQIVTLPRRVRLVCGAVSAPARRVAGRVATRTSAVVLVPGTAARPRPVHLDVRRSEVAAGLVIGAVLLAPLLLYGPTDRKNWASACSRARSSTAPCSRGAGRSG